MIQKSLICGLILVASSCVTGPKNPHQTTLEKLNGENYESSQLYSVANQPVITAKTKLQQRKFSGHVFGGQGVGRYPIHNARVQLWIKDQVVRTATTDPSGAYTFNYPFEESYDCVIKVKSRLGNYEKTLHLGTEDKLVDLEIEVDGK